MGGFINYSHVASRARACKVVPVTEISVIYFFFFSLAKFSREARSEKVGSAAVYELGRRRNPAAANAEVGPIFVGARATAAVRMTDGPDRAFWQ